MRNMLLVLVAILVGIPTLADAQYHDAEVFEAKGRVKMITEMLIRPDQTVRSTYSFSPSGELWATYQGDIVSLERDEQGRLAKCVYNNYGSYYQYEYDAQGRVSCLSFSGGKGHTEYAYDDRGLVIKEIEEFYSITQSRYQYVAFDEQGNWTERVCDREEDQYREKREIFYWPETVSGEGFVPGGPRRMIEVRDQASSGGDVRYIDEKYRSLVECVLHGRQNDYTVTIGRTTLSSMNQLGDVVYTDMRGKGENVSVLQMGAFDTEVTFYGLSTGVLEYIDYQPKSIPEAWKTLYGIDQNIYQDPARRQKLAAQGFKFLSETESSIFNDGMETYYVGNDESDRSILLTLLFDHYDELCGIRVLLEKDKDGNFPQLPERSGETGSAATVSRENTTTSSSGGGFLKAFDKLARATAQKEAQARQAEVQVSTSTASGEASGASTLSVGSMVEHPFGVLDRTVTASAAVQQLVAKGWMAELLNQTRIELSPQRGYELAYDGRMPRASAVFSEAGQLLSYDYTFTNVGGEDIPETISQTILRLQAVRFAYLLSSELETQGVKFVEEPANPSDQEELMLCSEQEGRTIRISVTYNQHNAYEVTLHVQLR